MRPRSYTLHLPPEARPGESLGLDRAQLVPDGFSWPAFAFSVAWFLYHRLWIAALVVLVGLVALAAAGHALGLARGTATLVSLFAAVLIGLEASSLRRWTLARRGWPARDVLWAGSLAEAEAKAMVRWLDPAARPAPPQRPAFAREAEPVIGLFPTREGIR